MVTIYHNTRCKKSREGLKYLQGKGIEFTIVDYISHPITEELLADIITKLGKKPVEILRTQEDVYKLKYKGKRFTNEQWIKILAENPRLIQRPIIVSGNKAVIAQPPELMDKIVTQARV